MKTHPPDHISVLKDEAINYLQVDKSAHLKAWIVDATLGLGGHTISILKSGGRVLGTDADKSSLEIARKRIHSACPAFNEGIESQFILMHGNFRNIDELVQKSGIKKVSGMLFDLGVSTPQLTSGNRGFSFQRGSAPLDMRLDQEGQSVTAADLLNSLDQTQLEKLFAQVLEVPKAKRLANKVVQKRQTQRFATVADFKSVTGTKGKPGLDPATLPFMALRIAVNSELDTLEETLPKAFEVLASGGRLVVISFHSGEDRIVKRFFKHLVEADQAKSLSKKPIRPTENEIKNNPLARSAKMRVITKNEVFKDKSSKNTNTKDTSST